MLKPMIGGALALVSACAVQTQSQAHTLSHAGACEIRETLTPRGVRLDAIAHADYALRGDYAFTVTARGDANASDITQAGPVDLAAGESATVGTTEIPDGAYRATLTLTDTAGELCRRVYRS